MRTHLQIYVCVSLTLPLAEEPNHRASLADPVDAGRRRLAPKVEGGRPVTVEQASGAPPARGYRGRGRQAVDEITLYKSVGVAVQDAAAVALILPAARGRGMGQEVAL
jgi:hypothetical protein